MTTESMEPIESRCRELFFHPNVQALDWPAWLFWNIDPMQAPARSEGLMSLKVDIYELEVILAYVTGKTSWCANMLDWEWPNRARFLYASLERGRMPLLRLKEQQHATSINSLEFQATYDEGISRVG